jgi:hypothetical protein
MMIVKESEPHEVGTFDCLLSQLIYSFQRGPYLGKTKAIASVV